MTAVTLIALFYLHYWNYRSYCRLWNCVSLTFSAPGTDLLDTMRLRGRSHFLLLAKLSVNFVENVKRQSFLFLSVCFQPFVHQSCNNFKKDFFPRSCHLGRKEKWIKLDLVHFMHLWDIFVSVRAFHDYGPSWCCERFSNYTLEKFER